MSALIGGMLIGLAAAAMLLGAGRIAGVSGIIAQGIGFSRSGMPRVSAWAFILAIPIGASIAAMMINRPAATLASPVILVAAGLLVGFGARYGSGCTSGHGVCGASRLSPRSLVAIAVFIVAGMVTVTAMRMIGLGQ